MRLHVLLILAVSIAACLLLVLLPAGPMVGQGSFKDWRVYGGDPTASHYSKLDQINRSNVKKLRPVWTFRTGDHRLDPPSAIQCNPIIIDGVLYATSPMLKVIALEADTGREKWRFDPFKGTGAHGVNRGVVYWEKGKEKRILFTAGSNLYALQAETGLPVPGFGSRGKVDLRQGLGRDVGELTFMVSSPGIIYRDLLILGSSVGEGPGPTAPGHIRAFDVGSGEQKWIFHTIPRPGEFGHDTWPADTWKYAGGANSWGGMALDVDRGIVYVPTGSPSYDFYGGDRPGKNLFGNCILALDAATGRRKWHFQTVHHDLWDYDIPCQPNLVTVRHQGRQVDAVAQVTKTGFVFLLDRESGAPLFPVEERPVPASDLKGEQAWPTQPFPLKPPPFSRQGFGLNKISRLSPQSSEEVRERLQSLRFGEPFIPPSQEGSVMMPFFNGGAEWGGAAFDPVTGMLYVNANDKPGIITMVETDQRSMSRGEAVYRYYCATCHGLERQGAPPDYPSLENLEQNSNRDEVLAIIKSGAGRMPAFSQIDFRELGVLMNFLFEEQANSPDSPERDTPVPEFESRYLYRHTGWHRFRDSLGYPASQPPWGTLNAIDLNQGEAVWSIPLGIYPELIEKGLPPTGTENYGGALVTAGGLLFIGATRDEKFRAFDKKTGELLWETILPAGGYATPSSYQVGNRQFVVIAAGGGGKQGTPSSDAYVAFALPEGEL